MKILMLPGDGIGPEISSATREVLAAASDAFGLKLAFEELPVGHASLEQYGATLPPNFAQRLRAADGIVLGPASTADFKDASKGEVNPSMYLRKELDLFANIRPARTMDGVKAPVGPFDIVVVRENVEGFYADRNMEKGNAEMLVTPDVAISLRRVTRYCSERIARAGFDLAMRRRKHVTLVHKANVLKIGDGLFLDSCRAVARDYPEVVVDDIIVDAMMAHAVRNPSKFDVIVTTNMFGDILSDLTAELSGSIGLGGSVNAGADHAMAQAAHGSAPDIAGQDKANPFSLILSAALLLDWMGQRHKREVFIKAGAAIEAAVREAVRAGESTADVGGRFGTQATGKALAARLRAK